jgi:sialidase-1
MNLWLTLAALAAVPAAELLPPVPVFEAAKDGFASIRIPSIVASRKGTLLAFAEGRAADADQAKNRILLKRSTDGGLTWGKVEVIAADGDRALNNPCAVVERKSGAILLMYQSYPAGVGERSGKIVPGYEGENILRNWLLVSQDDGATWGKPRDITRETKREKQVTTLAGGRASASNFGTASTPGASSSPSTKGRSASGTSTPCTATTRARLGTWATLPPARSWMPARTRRRAW